MANEMIAYINSLGGVNFMDYIFKKITIGNKSKTKNVSLNYFLRSLRKPFTFKTSKIISNKLIWTELNDLIYGKGNWE
jgi:hypothetical protein